MPFRSSIMSFYNYKKSLFNRLSLKSTEQELVIKVLLSHLRVPDETMKINIRKWHSSCKLNSHHDHSCNPEEQNVMAAKKKERESYNIMEVNGKINNQHKEQRNSIIAGLKDQKVNKVVAEDNIPSLKNSCRIKVLKILTG